MTTDRMNITTAAVYNPDLDTLVEVDLTNLPEWAPHLAELRAEAAAAGDTEEVRTIDRIIVETVMRHPELLERHGRSRPAH